MADDPRPALYEALTTIVSDIGAIDDESSRRAAAHMLHCLLRRPTGDATVLASEIHGEVSSALATLHQVLLDGGDSPEAWEEAAESLTAALVPFLAAQPTDEPTEADPQWAERVREATTEVLDVNDLALGLAEVRQRGSAQWARMVYDSHEKLRALVGGRSAAPTRDEIRAGVLAPLALADGSNITDLVAAEDRMVALLSRSAAEPPEDQERERVRVELTPDDLDGGYVAEVTSLPGCVSQGDTVPEALVNLADAYAAIKGGVAAEPNEGRAVMRGLSIYDEDTGAQLAGPEIDAADAKREAEALRAMVSDCRDIVAECGADIDGHAPIDDIARIVGYPDPAGVAAEPHKEHGDGA